MHVTGAYSTEQVARLTGLTRQQIEDWDTAGVYQPSLLRDPDRRPFGRIYTFQDVVALRTLAVVRKRVSLRVLRQLGVWLKRSDGEPWPRLRFYIVPGGEIAYDDPRADGAERIEIEPIAIEANRLLQHLQTHREQCDIGVIRRNRYVMRNEWVVAGTRIPVWLIQELSVAGANSQDIVREFPILTDADVRAALAFDLPDVAQLAS